MPFRLIKGTYHVVGYSPDGDSIRFKADDETNWQLPGITGPPVKLNAKRHAQLRLEAIDTLETHFQNTHQPLTLATSALTSLLAKLGITKVKWDPARTKVISAKDGTPGYILTREVEKNQRPVAFAFAGQAPEVDGSSIILKAARLLKSVNASQLATGMAYPTYYKGLFPDLRKALTQVAKQARTDKLGVWAKDVTNTGFNVTGLAALENDVVILPKLFRRLAEFLEAGGNVTLFKEFLEAKNEEIIIISGVHPTHFDTVVQVIGQNVRMTEPPENVIFVG
jgi:hypothetical protein